MGAARSEVGTVGYAAPEMLAGTATGFEGDEARLPTLWVSSTELHI